jgi:hypothetical protein
MASDANTANVAQWRGLVASIDILLTVLLFLPQ